jgi:hypothetical protein
MSFSRPTEIFHFGSVSIELGFEFLLWGNRQLCRRPGKSPATRAGVTFVGLYAPSRGGNPGIHNPPVQFVFGGREAYPPVGSPKFGGRARRARNSAVVLPPRTPPETPEVFPWEEGLVGTPPGGEFPELGSLGAPRGVRCVPKILKGWGEPP